jgi:uncharacterized coiled-coil protein SlyX
VRRGEEVVAMVRLARFTGRRTVLIGALGVVALLVAGLAVGLIGAGNHRGGAASSGLAAPSLSAVPGARSAAPAGDGAVSDAATPESAVAPGTPTDPGQGVPVGDVQRALVRTAQIGVEAEDPGASSRQVRTAAAAVGGFVTEEQTSDRSSRLVLRVPAEALDRLIDDIAGKARVTSRSSQVVDATEKVVDLDARVAAQQASVARVRALLAQATSIGDVVAIESELSRREADLDSLTGRLKALQGQVAFSTLTVDIDEPGVPVDDEPRAAGFLGGLADGWDGLRALGAGVGVVVGFLLPFVPVIAVLVGIGWLGRRIVRARRTPAPAAAGGRSDPGSEGES